MRHQRHGTGTSIENYTSIGLLKVKDVKKRKGIFFRFVLLHRGSTKVGPKSRHFMPVNGAGFKKIFFLQIKNLSTSENTMVKRWRSNADLDLLLSARFSLTITVNKV